MEDDETRSAKENAYRVSIHVPRVEDDELSVKSEGGKSEFQSTSPVWRTTRLGLGRLRELYVSIHVPRVEDDATQEKRCDAVHVSIHVPRVEDDHQTNYYGVMDGGFNPRPPCGGRLKNADGSNGRHWFQSTSPVWRTTSLLSMSQTRAIVSIHVPRVEDD